MQTGEASAQSLAFCGLAPLTGATLWMLWQVAPLLGSAADTVRVVVGRQLSEK